MDRYDNNLSFDLPKNSFQFSRTDGKGKEFCSINGGKYINEKGEESYSDTLFISAPDISNSPFDNGDNDEIVFSLDGNVENYITILGRDLKVTGQDFKVYQMAIWMKKGTCVYQLLGDKVCGKNDEKSFNRWAGFWKTVVESALIDGEQVELNGFSAEILKSKIINPDEITFSESGHVNKTKKSAKRKRAVENDNLKKELDEKEKILADKKKELKEAESVRINLSSELDSLIVASANIIEKFRPQVEVLEKQLKNLMEEFNAAEKAHEKSARTIDGKLKLKLIEVSDAKACYDKLQSVADVANSKLETGIFKKNKDQKMADYEQKQASADAAKDVYNKLDEVYQIIKSKYDEENSEFETKRDVYLKENAKLSADLKQLKSELAASESKNTNKKIQLEKNIAGLDIKMAKLTDEIAEIDRIIVKLKEKNKQ